MKSAHLIPHVGTAIALTHRNVDFRGENKVPSIRIIYNPERDVWEQSPVGGKGLLVFLNDVPKETDTHVVINRIIKTGKAAWGDSTSM